MIAQRLIFIGGILVAIMPHLGFPSSVDTFLYALIGLAIALISFLFRDFKKSIKLRSPKKEQEGAFVENSLAELAEKKRAFRRKPKIVHSPVSGASPLISDITPPKNSETLDTRKYESSQNF